MALTSLLLAGCATDRLDRRVSLVRKTPQPAEASRWKAIGTADVSSAGFRKVLDEFLRVTGPNDLWPGYTLDDHGVILADNRRPSMPEVVCAGFCGKTSRLCRLDRPPKLPETYIYANGRDWGLPQQSDVVVVPFDGTETSMFVVLHEDFHLTFQSEYVQQHPDAFEPAERTTTRFTRRMLEHEYVGAAEVLRDVRGECNALAAALRDEPGSRAELARFVAIRESRRSKPGAPAFEEDYWERLEGVPTNLERRMAAALRIRDASLIQTILDHGCEITGPTPYFIVLGGLEAALLDRYEPESWPSAVYPDHGRAATLYERLKKYAVPIERN